MKATDETTDPTPLSALMRLRELTDRLGDAALRDGDPQQGLWRYSGLLSQTAKLMAQTTGKRHGEPPALGRDAFMAVLLPQLRQDLSIWFNIIAPATLNEFVHKTLQDLLYLEKAAARAWPPASPAADKTVNLVHRDSLSLFIDEAFNKAATEVREHDKRLGLVLKLQEMMRHDPVRKRLWEKVFHNGTLWTQKPMAAAIWNNDNGEPPLFIDAQLDVRNGKAEFAFLFIRAGQEITSPPRLTPATISPIGSLARYNANDMAQIAKETTPDNLHRPFLRQRPWQDGNFTRYAMLQACRHAAKQLVLIDYSYGSTHTLFKGFSDLLGALDSTAARLKLPDIKLG